MHVDDLSRNFALNPKNGIKCSAYRREATSANEDSELQLLAFYLVHIATTKPINITTSGGTVSTTSGTTSGGSTGASSSSSTLTSDEDINLIAWDHTHWRETASALRLGSSLTRN